MLWSAGLARGRAAGAGRWLLRTLLGRAVPEGSGPRQQQGLNAGLPCPDAPFSGTWSWREDTSFFPSHPTFAWSSLCRLLSRPVSGLLPRPERGAEHFLEADSVPKNNTPPLCAHVGLSSHPSRVSMKHHLIFLLGRGDGVSLLSAALWWEPTSTPRERWHRRPNHSLGICRLCT